MSARTVLLDDGTEVVMALSGKPYFTDESGALLQPVYTDGAEAQARATADGIFRVWSTVFNDADSFPMFKGNYPLNEAAEQARAAWDTSNPESLRCWRKGMPLLMITPLPIEFTRDAEDIIIRLEEDDAQRRIQMNAGPAARPASQTILGVSTGHWEGNTLVVETTDIDFPFLDDRGAPQSGNVHLLERFTLNEAQDRLDYRITITDPDTFTRPFDLTRYWVWRPEIVVSRWDCQEYEID